MSDLSLRPHIGLFAMAALFVFPVFVYPQTNESASIDSVSLPLESAPDISIEESESGKVRSVLVTPKHFQWQGAAVDSGKFLLLQTAGRIAFQDKTRDGLGGPFVKDYFRTLGQRPRGFMDGDSWFTNFVGHPIQGATSYHIARFRGASRNQAFWWGVAYSTNFELGPLGEAGMGNVRISPVDLLVTPTAGFVLGASEEWAFDRLSRFNNKLAKVVRIALVGRRLSRVVGGTRN
jgi:hypothetical protein